MFTFNLLYCFLYSENLKKKLRKRKIVIKLAILLILILSYKAA